MARKKGFTLIELLVVIAIIALLLAIMMPALGMVKERAKRIVCGSNLKQIGIGVMTYASSNNNRIPPARLLGSDFARNAGYAAYTAYWVDINATSSHADRITAGPWNLAYLHHTGIIKDPKVFYCESANLVGKAWTYDYYNGTLGWPFPADPGADHSYLIRTSYSYFPTGKGRETLTKGSYKMRVRMKSNNGNDMTSSSSIAADIVNTKDSVLHKGSMGKPGGINVLYGDGHAQFSNNKEAINAPDDLWMNPDPNGDATTFRMILGLFDGSAQYVN